METVFEISLWSNGNLVGYFLRIIAGVVLLLVLLPRGIRKRKEKKGPESLVGVILPAVAMPVWIIVHSLLMWNYFIRTEEIIENYRKEKFSTSEGVVEVLYTQAKGGHDRPDRIRIGGNEFTIQHFSTTPFYRNTVKNRGSLKDGVFARIRHIHNDILKVEIRKRTSRG